MFFRSHNASHSMLSSYWFGDTRVSSSSILQRFPKLANFTKQKVERKVKVRHRNLETFTLIHTLWHKNIAEHSKSQEPQVSCVDTVSQQ